MKKILSLAVLLFIVQIARADYALVWVSGYPSVPCYLQTWAFPNSSAASVYCENYGGCNVYNNGYQYIVDAQAYVAAQCSIWTAQLTADAHPTVFTGIAGVESHAQGSAGGRNYSVWRDDLCNGQTLGTGSSVFVPC